MCWSTSGGGRKSYEERQIIMRKRLILPLAAGVFLLFTALTGNRPASATVGSIFCVTDDATGNSIVFNQAGGYQVCLNAGGTLNGSGGRIRVNSGIVTLTDTSLPGQKVSAGFNTGTLTGSGVVSFRPAPGAAWRSVHINQTK